VLVKPKFAAVLFDLDGTLIDSFQHLFHAVNYALCRQGVKPISGKALSKLAGRPTIDKYSVLAPGADLKQLMADHAAFKNAHPELVMPYPGLAKVLEELRAKGIKLAIVTARSRRSVNIAIDKAKLGDKVDLVLPSDEVELPKPHPHPFLLAASKLGVKPGECLVVGDGEADIESGHAAGMKTCRAMYGYGAMERGGIKSDFEISSLAQLLEVVK